MFRCQIALAFWTLSFAYLNQAQAFDLDLNVGQSVQYSKIKPNTVIFSNGVLKISVKKSSSAIVYPFKKLRDVQRVKISAKINGNIEYGNLSPGSLYADDFPLRLGIVVQGKHKLKFWQKTFAPLWLKKLNSLSSQYGGLDKVYSLLFYLQKPSFESRAHPESKYFYELPLGRLKPDESEFNHQFEESIKGIGLWLSSDGDDTGSTFEVMIDKISIN